MFIYRKGFQDIGLSFKSLSWHCRIQDVIKYFVDFKKMEYTLYLVLLSQCIQRLIVYVCVGTRDSSLRDSEDRMRFLADLVQVMILHEIAITILCFEV